MANVAVRVPNPLAYLPHQGREFEGHAPLDACSPEVAEKNAEEAIRKIMAAQKRQISRRSLPELEPCPTQAEGVPGAAVAPKVRVGRETHKASKKIWGQEMAALKRFRLSRKLSLLAVCALVMVWHPLLLPAVIFVTFWVALIAYLTLGPDRVAELVAAAWRRLAMRKPALAESLRCRADAAAMKFEALLDRLPGNLDDRISLPDFSDPATRIAEQGAQSEPFDRLAEASRGD